ncbi:MAG: tetratricopeptide repeat protein, partial [Campylobacterota bacterium]
MKYLLSLLFFFLPLSGFEMNIKSGKLQGQKYSLLRLHEPTRPIKCREDIDEYMQVQSVTCKVDRSFARDIEELSHPLFSIDLQKDRASFTLRISSPVKLKLFDKTKPFYQQKEIDYFDTQEANNWLILAYSDKMPYIDKQSATGMGFPIPTDFESLPAVGAVDMDSLPVASRTSDDVNAFADLEKEFEQGNYSTVLQSSKQLLQRYDESIFKSDFLRYKIKAMYHMAPADNFDAIVKDSKRFLREYSSDEYLPEILLLLAKTYDKSGFSGDAKYFYERLIAEHEGSFHAAMGKVEYALFVADNEENADGAKLLEDVFYDTSHMAAAAYAADELVKIYLDRDAIEEALRYVKVIWENDR